MSSQLQCARSRVRSGGTGLAAAVLVLGVAALGAADARAQSRVIVRPDAARAVLTLPAGIRGPRGITRDPRTGDLFIGTFAPNGQNFVFRFDRQGQLAAQVAFGPQPLLSIAFNPRDGMVYVAVPNMGRIQRVPANFSASTRPEDVALLPALPPAAGSRPATPAPNGVVFRESDGALLVTDQAQGAIFLVRDPSQRANTCATGSACVTLVLRDARLQPVPNRIPVGANGIALSRDERRLFVNNTSRSMIFTADLAAQPLRITPFSSMAPGPDGLIRGPGNTLIATAIDSNQVIVLDMANGQQLAVLGAFLGVDGRGAAMGLQTPANLVLIGETLLVTNLGGGGVGARRANVASVSSIQLPPELLQGLVEPVSAPGLPAVP